MEPPAAVRAIGSLNALLGVAGLVAAATTGAGLATAGSREQWHVLGMTDAARFWAVAAGLVLLILGNSVVQLTAGIGLLRLHGWGVSASRGYAWYSLLFAAGYAFLHFTLFFSTYITWLTQGPGTLSRPMALALVIAAGIVGPMLLVIYPVITLVSLRGGSLREAIETAGSVPRSDDRLSLIPQFTLRRLLLLMAASSVFFLVLGNAFAGRAWAIAMSMGGLLLMATFALYGAAFFLVWILSLIWKPRSTVPSRVAVAHPTPPPSVAQSPFQPV